MGVQVPPGAPNRGLTMYNVHHVFPTTSEWGSVIVDTLEEAEQWYECKRKSRNSIGVVLTLYDVDDNIVKQETIGS